MPTFNEALLYGKKVEKLVLERVRESDPYALLIPGKFKQFDLYSPSSNTRVEIKSDIKSQETNNFLIEVYQCNIVITRNSNRIDNRWNDILQVNGIVKLNSAWDISFAIVDGVICWDNF